MLFLVLALVVVAFGLLVTALATSAMVWAWLSVGASVVAAAALVVDWRRRRRRSSALPPPPPVAAPPPAVDGVEVDTDAEPAEEDTDTADLLAVTELDTEVRVVDERPRYHLATCTWLADRPTLTLPVREARELGFTPCAVCSPDRSLAAAHRTG